MHEIKVDYIVVGQGIAGTWLSYELIRRNLDIVVIDVDSKDSASKKAAGLYNPITGRKMVKTWRADDFFPSLESNYLALEKLTGAKFLYPMPIYRPFGNHADQNDWQGRQSDLAYHDYLEKVRLKSMGIPNVTDPNGGIVLNHSGYVDLPILLDAYKKYLQTKGVYHSEQFDFSELMLEEDSILYRGIKARKVIFCEGPKFSSYWDHLPFKLVRGEIMDIACELAVDMIINQGVFIIPKNGYFTVGSTYDHKKLTSEPQPEGIKNLEQRLGKIFAGKYRIIGERAGVRPATHDRKPYIGFHKKNRTLAIFNGFGTKGVSLSPYFAHHFADVLENKCVLDKEVNIERVS